MGGGVALVGRHHLPLYHPPKPCYEKGVLMDFIERSLEELLTVDMRAAVILGGDFNGLNVEEVSIRTGLVPLVKAPTRGKKILGMLMTSIPDQYNIKVVASMVRTDHKAVVATMASDVRDRSKTSVKKFNRRRTPNQNASLLLALQMPRC